MFNKRLIFLKPVHNEIRYSLWAIQTIGWAFLWRGLIAGKGNKLYLEDKIAACHNLDGVLQFWQSAHHGNLQPELSLIGYGRVATGTHQAEVHHDLAPGTQREHVPSFGGEQGLATPCMAQSVTVFAGLVRIDLMMAVFDQANS